MKPRVAVVVLNWNGRNFLKVCLDSLLRQSYNNSYVIFVDNASSDGSAEFVENNYKSKIKSGKVIIIRNRENFGFAEGNNVGIRKALSDRKTKYVVILNNDTEAHKGWIKELVSVAEKYKDAGSVASKVLDFKKKSMVDTCGIGLYSDGLGFGIGYGEDEKNFSSETEVFGAYGAAAFYKRKMLEDTKLGNDYFDSEYFVFQEELDLSWRAQLRGWKCVLAPNARVYHVGSGTFRHIPNKGKFLLERNRISNLVKNLQKDLVWYCLPRIILYEIISMPLYFMNGQIFAVVKGRVHGLAKMKKFSAKRNYIQKRSKAKPEEILRLMTNRNYLRSLIRNA